MTKPNTDVGFDLLMVRSFFDSETCREFITEMCRSPVAAATVYGRGESVSVDERVRKGARVMPSQDTAERVRRRLLDSQGEVGEHFGVSLSSCEEPQFLRYRVGDFFVAHQDGNTGMLRLEQEARRVSVTIFLSRQSDAPEDGAYSGGSLVFSEWRSGPGSGELRLAGEAGTLVAFRSETTHEVTPVTHGERHSIACWYR